MDQYNNILSDYSGLIPSALLVSGILGKNLLFPEATNTLRSVFYSLLLLIIFMTILLIRKSMNK